MATEGRGDALSIYLIVQDVDQLYGEYLYRAVVAAHTPEEAIDLIVAWCGADGDDDTTACVHRDRLTVWRVGPCEAPVEGEVILCVAIGIDDDGPQSYGDEVKDADDEGEDEDDDEATVELLVNIVKFADPDRNAANIATVKETVGIEPSSVDDLDGSIDVLFHLTDFDEAGKLADAVNELPFVNGTSAYDTATGEG